MKKPRLFVSIATLALLLTVGLSACNLGGDSSSNLSSSQQSASSARSSASVSSGSPSSSSSKASSAAASSAAPSSSSKASSSSATPSSSSAAPSSLSSAVSSSAAPSSSVSGGEIKVEAETGTLGDGMALYTPSTSASGQIIGTWPAGSTLTVTFSAPAAGVMTLSMTARANKVGSTFTQVNLATDVEFKFNDVVLTLTGTTTANQTFSTVPLGDVTVLAGNNVIAIKAIAAGPGLDYFTLAPKVA